MERNEAEPRTRDELVAILEVTRSKLERADEVENTFERYMQQDKLWEEIDSLEAEIDVIRNDSTS
jgi:hypothetical protein